MEGKMASLWRYLAVVNHRPVQWAGDLGRGEEEFSGSESVRGRCFEGDGTCDQFALLGEAYPPARPWQLASGSQKAASICSLEGFAGDTH
jgi:hypothetical protein